ncbi:hypothetical protein IV203_036584 [Nitzschia inconspicua]|uniref:Uncharacterized protein n=1 Tax=Nitzschia inconspicua TaxID=303405 RepID=A0A9K3PVS3_9STRA|nr:hypothetical protein IV203_036584 [Nitzschia inconspicua]
MLDAVMVNTWRAYQAVTDIAPWLATLDSTPSLKQLRNHLYRKGSIRQFVFDTSYESLRLIAIQKTVIRPPFFPPANTQRTLGETFFLQQYTSYCRKNSWPIKRNARERFVEDPFLQKLRLRSFVGFEHKAEPIRDVLSGVTPGPDSRARRKCVLCFVSGNKVPRESRYSPTSLGMTSFHYIQVYDNFDRTQDHLDPLPGERTKEKPQEIMNSRWLWNQVVAGNILVFRGNGAFCANSKSIIHVWTLTMWDFLGGAMVEGGMAAVIRFTNSR